MGQNDNATPPSRETGSSWLKGAVYLSLAAFTAKGLSALYKVPYQNITGDTGFYVYQQVYPLYGIAFVLGTYGFPLVIARMMVQDSDRKTSEITDDTERRMAFIVTVLFIFHALLSVLIFFSAGTLASFMGDPRLEEAIRWMSAPFLVIPFLAAGRGIAQGTGNTVPTAITQVAEQFVRIIAILLIAVWAMNMGDPYLAGNSAGAGALAGGIAAVLLFIFLNRRQKGSFSFASVKLTGLMHNRWKSDLKELLLSGMFVSVSAMALVVFQLADTFTVFRQLTASGLTAAEAAAVKGVYDRGWPLIQFGAVITTVFSYAAVPVIGRAVEQQDLKTVREETGRALKLCLVFGGAAAAGLAAVMAPLNTMMFTDGQGTATLQLFSFTVIFGALFMTAAALLHAAGKSFHAVLLLSAGLLAKVLLNMWFVPVFGITGAAAASVLAFAGISALSLYVLKRRQMWITLPVLFWAKWLAGLAALVMVVHLYLWSTSFIFDGGRTAAVFEALSAAVAGAVLYILIVRRLRLFSKPEWESLPKIGKYIPYK